MKGLYKLFILAFLTCGNINIQASPQELAANIKKISSIKADPKRTFIVLDFHDVLVKYPVTSAFNNFWQSTQKIAFLKGVAKYLNNKLFYDNGHNPDIHIEKALQQPNGGLPDNSLELMNAHTPILETIAILKKLKSKGYKIVLCSHIGPKSCDFMKAKYPEIFENIDYVVIPNQENNYRMKSKEMFEDVWNIAKNDLIKDNIKEEEIKAIVIDDKQKNLGFAEKVLNNKNEAVFVGVRFTNAIDLKAILHKFLI